MTQAPPVIDVRRIIGSSVVQVEAITGAPYDIVPFGADTPELAGGASRFYDIGKLEIFVDFDRNGIARGFQVWDGLSTEGYSLRDWKALLAQFGLNVTARADLEAAQAYYWNNWSGYKITIAALSATGRPVWTVQVWDAGFFGN